MTFLTLIKFINILYAIGSFFIGYFIIHRLSRLVELAMVVCYPQLTIHQASLEKS